MLISPMVAACQFAVGMVHDENGSMALFPERPGQPICDFYQKTGHCRFGEACKFDHPPQFAVRLNPRGLPLRPGQAVCAFYQRTGECKFGPSCKFHHPAV
jgi:serine/threonine-protein kinase/endoribonuclease IRE1